MKCKLSTLMGERRLSIQDVHEQTKLSRTTISNLYNEKATRIDYDTIEKLCLLFECGVAELLCVENIMGDRKND
ncbi:putative transcriptional regulator [Pilibacter termitis]|uniref:Putative transcriptional regulator n=1 Tax=Pilibacter termitis TaxID=263852 RepID=A0A1T4PS95_9ENTE|nr:helix-turn-helix transcriptional regulator [Pilibacter termitis]SJZ94514.1 putative transcriptional regulator [Pilibacter termitis]